MAYEIVGYEDDEEVGALAPRFASAFASRFARKGPVAQARTMGRRIVASGQRVEPLGLGSLSIGAGASGTISAVAQKPYQPQRLVLGGTLASFTVTQVQVGTRSCLAGVSGLPATLFSEVAVGTGILFPAGGTGVTLSVTATNTSAGALTLSGAFIGLTSS